MDGPVEIELEPGDGDRRRGRRARRHDTAGPADSAGAITTGAGPTGDGPTRDDPATERRWTGDHRSRRAALVGGAVALFVAGAVAGGLARGGDTPATNGEPPGGSAADEASDRAGPNGGPGPGGDADSGGDADRGDEEEPDDDSEPDGVAVPEATLPPARDDAGASGDAGDGTADLGAAADGAAEEERDPADDDEPVVRVEELGRPLLHGPTGLTLVGLSTAGDLVEVDIDRGTIRHTAVADHLGRSPGHHLVVGEAGTVVVTLGPTGPDARVVAVGEGAVPTTLGSDHGLQMMAPGPGAMTAWMPRRGTTTFVEPAGLELVDMFTGERLATTTEIEGVDRIDTDGAGGLLLGGIGGTYSVRAEHGTDGADEGTVVVEPQRLTAGEVVAVGPAHVVTIECDETLRCGGVRIERASGERVPVDIGNRPVTRWWDHDRVSPDGGSLAGVDASAAVQRYVHVDLQTGESTVFGDAPPDRTGFYVGLSVAWSDDGRFVLFLDDDGVAYHDVETGESGHVGGGVVLPDLLVFDVRRAGAADAARATTASAQRGSSASSARSGPAMSSRRSATMRVR